ncbi:TPA: nuclear RNA export factor 3-like [Bos taurus]|nr:TPA: nuclear RNA export factor 3-like [Bos taurus]
MKGLETTKEEKSLSDVSDDAEMEQTRELAGGQNVLARNVTPGGRKVFGACALPTSAVFFDILQASSSRPTDSLPGQPVRTVVTDLCLQATLWVFGACALPTSAVFLKLLQASILQASSSRPTDSLPGQPVRTVVTDLCLQATLWVFGACALPTSAVFFDILQASSSRPTDSLPGQPVRTVVTDLCLQATLWVFGACALPTSAVFFDILQASSSRPTDSLPGQPVRTVVTDLCLQATLWLSGLCETFSSEPPKAGKVFGACALPTSAVFFDILQASSSRPTDSLPGQPVRTVVTDLCLQATLWVSGLCETFSSEPPKAGKVLGSLPHPKAQDPQPVDCSSGKAGREPRLTIFRSLEEMGQAGSDTPISIPCGHTDKVNPLQRRARSSGITQRQYACWSEPVTSQQQQDRDSKESDAQHTDKVNSLQRRARSSGITQRQYACWSEPVTSQQQEDRDSKESDAQHTDKVKSLQRRARSSGITQRQYACWSEPVTSQQQEDRDSKESDAQHTDKVNSLQRRARSSGITQRQYACWSEPVTSQQQQDRDSKESDARHTDKVNPLQRRARSSGITQRQYACWSEPVTSQQQEDRDSKESDARHTDKVNPLQRRARSSGITQRQYACWSEPVTSQQQQDRDSKESDAQHTDKVKSLQRRARSSGITQRQYACWSEPVTSQQQQDRDSKKVMLVWTSKEDKHTDKVNSLQRRARSSGITQRQYACWSEPVTSQQQQDRDSKESDARMDIQGRYAPYAIPSHHWRSSFQRKDQMHVNMETEQKPPERTMKTNRQDETLGSWFKIIIPFGIKYDEKWLMNLIQKKCSVPFIAVEIPFGIKYDEKWLMNLIQKKCSVPFTAVEIPFDIKYDEKWLMNLIQKKCSVPFTAVEFHYEKMQAQFFVKNANVACALKNVSGKICNEDNEKISIFVEPCDAPESVQKTLTSEKLEQIKIPFGIKYDEKWLMNLIQKKCSVPFTAVEFHYEKMQAQFFVENANVACALKNVSGKICNEDNEKIPFGIKYDEKWLMNLIQKKCSVPFTAVEFHYEKMQAQFFVENANVACALKNVSGKICNEDNEKISIFVEPCDAPESVQKTLTSEKLEQIKTQARWTPSLTLQLTMNKPYDACQQGLDIQRLRFGPEHTDKVNSLQRRARSSGIYRRQYAYWSEPVTSQQQEDKDSKESDAHMDIQGRYAPYAIPSHHWRSSFQTKDQMHVNMQTDQKPPEGTMKTNRQDETLGSWFKIIIPFGIKYDEKWLMNLIQKKCSVPFTAVEFHYEKMQAQFFVENANVACALKNVSGKICNEDNEKISIFVEPCDAPESVQKTLTSEKLEQIKLTMNKPYDACQQALDIQRLRFGPGMPTVVTAGQIPFGIKYDEKWLMNLIQKKCSVPFTAVEFHYEKMQAQFFVENANVACALKNVSGKICNEDNEKISIFVEPCDAPQSVQKTLTSEKLEQIKTQARWTPSLTLQLTMNKPYDACQQALDIQRLRFGPGMATVVTAGQFHYEKMQAQFFVENANVACALKNVSGKICNEDNEKISIFVEPCDAPESVQKTLTSEKLEQIKTQARWTPSLTLQLTMNKPYDACQQALDIQRLHFGPGMATVVTAGQFHYEKMQAQFFVENANVACALKNVSGKICNEDNEKISIFVEPCDAPESVQKTLTSEKLEQIKTQARWTPSLTLQLTMNKPYDACQQGLDIQRLRFGPGMATVVTAGQFHYEKMQAQFFVENANVACALKNVSGKICNEDNEKISIFVEPCDAPESVQKTLTSEKLEQIKTQARWTPSLTLQLTMNKPYDACQQGLDIQRLRFGPGMATVVTAGQISIFVEPCDAPESVQKTLTSEKLEQIKTQARWTPSLTLQLTMNKPYDACQQALDIQRLRFGPAFIFVLEQQETVLGAWPVHHYGIATTTENLNLSTTEISIFVEPCDAPQSVQKTLTSEKLEQIKTQARWTPFLTLQLTMNKPYDACQQALDIQRLRFGPGMATVVTAGQLSSLYLSNKKPYLVHGLSTIKEIASTTKNLNLSNTEVRWGTQILLRKECGRPYGWRQTKENGFISIFVEPCDAPESVRKTLTSEKLEQIKTQARWTPSLTLQLTMNKPYDACQQGLDIQRLRFGPGMATVVTAGQLSSLYLSNKKPYLVHGLSTIKEIASTTKNLNLSNTETQARWTPFLTLQLTMNKPYDACQQALDIQRLRFGPGMPTVVTAGQLSSLYLSNKKPYLVHGLSTIKEIASTTKNLNLSNTEVRWGTQILLRKECGRPYGWRQTKENGFVKIAGEMDKGHQLEPEGMCADRSAVCTTFRDESANMSTLLELFPRLLSLDGQETLSGSKCAVEAPKCLPMCKGSFFGSEELKSLILKFLQQYYLIHDYGDRQGLLGAYHEEACFSLAIPFQPKDPALSSMCAYFLDNRNMKILKDPNLRVQMMKHTKHDIVHTLCALPKTQHDFSSFVVDMCFQMEMMLCFSVNGVFKEVEGISQGCVCAFTRTFTTTPTSSSSFCIVNDELFVREASPIEAQHLHSPSLCQPPSWSSSPSNLRVQMMKHTKHDIVHTLCALPKTQHDFSSFVVDMCFQMWKERLLAVCVPSPGPSLLPLPALPGESRVLGRNPHPAWAQGPGYVDADLRFTQYYGKSAGRAKDQSSLVVRKTSAFSIPVPTLTSSSTHTLSQEQQEMVQALFITSGMKLE